MSGRVIEWGYMSVCMLLVVTLPACHVLSLGHPSTLTCQVTGSLTLNDHRLICSEQIQFVKLLCLRL